MTVEQTDNNGNAAELEEILSGITEKIRTQIELVRKEEYDAFIESCEETNVMMQNIEGNPSPVTDVATGFIQEIQNLNRELGVVLSQQRNEVTQKLHSLKSGKKAAKAYSGS